MIDLQLPKLKSRWHRGDNGFDPLSEKYNGYTVVCITNIANPHEKHEPQVVYRGDNGKVWSLPVSRWPGNLVPENDEFYFTPVAHIPDWIYDGYAVYYQLSEEAKNRTGTVGVSDVLDAIKVLLEKGGQDE